MAFIRPYKPSDFDDTAHICRATLHPALVPSKAAHLLAPYLWLHQYTLLSPATCHVLDDGSGRAVGYCIGTPDVDEFAAAYPRYVAEVLEKSPELAGKRPRSLEVRAPWTDPETGQASEEGMLQVAWNPKWLVLEEDTEALWGEWKATMHIDLLDEWQYKGWGTKLIERFVESLREADGRREGEGRLYGRGIHIGMSTGKTVSKFYEKQGFRMHPISDEGGEWMVRDLE